MSTWTDEERAAYRLDARKQKAAEDRTLMVAGLIILAIGALLGYFLALPVVEGERDVTMWVAIVSVGLPGLLIVFGAAGALAPIVPPLIKYAMDLVGKDKPHDDGASND